MNVPSEIDPRIVNRIHPSYAERKTKLAKLTDEQVRLMRFNYARCYRNAYQLAAQYGVSQATVSQIVQGSTYKSAGGLITWPGEHEPPAGKRRGYCYDVACDKPISTQNYWAQRMHFCDDCFRINGGKKHRPRRGELLTRKCCVCKTPFTYYRRPSGKRREACSHECATVLGNNKRRIRPKDLTADVLYELYWGQGLTLKQIAARFNNQFSPDTVRYWLRGDGVSLRAKRRIRLTLCAIEGCQQPIKQQISRAKTSYGYFYGRLCDQHLRERDARRYQIRCSETAEERGELLAAIVHKLLVGLPDSVRRDAESEIVLAALSGTLDINALNRETVKPFITAAFRENADQYRFLSIQAPCLDGDDVQTWGQRLGLS